MNSKKFASTLILGVVFADTVTPLDYLSHVLLGHEHQVPSIPAPPPFSMVPSHEHPETPSIPEQLPRITVTVVSTGTVGPSIMGYGS